LTRRDPLRKGSSNANRQCNPVADLLRHLCCGDGYQVGFAAELNLLNLIVWYKQSGSMGSLYRSAHELVAVFCKGDSPRTNNTQLGRHGRDRQNVWLAPGANRRGSSANAMLEFHSTPKPVELCVDATLRSSAANPACLMFHFPVPPR